MTPKDILSKVTAWGSRFSSRTLWAAGSLVFGIAAGVGSAVVALNTVGLTAANAPNDWQEWNLSDDSLTLPYALGHFLNAGHVPPTKASRQFIRRVDDKGLSLDTACVTEVSGAIPAARWWTLAAAAPDGSIVSDRSVLSAGQAVLEANGKLLARVAASPAPGNWIVAPARGSFTLVLTIHDPSGPIVPSGLPSIARGDC